MKKIWFILLLLVYVQCSSLSLATKSYHQTYRVKSLSHADIKFQLNRLYFRPITPSFIYWMPAYEGALNSWESIARQQLRWDWIYGAGSPDFSWHWFTPYYTNTWYNPNTFGWFPMPNYYINPYTGNLSPRGETPKPKPRSNPRPRLPKDVYLSTPSNTAGNTLETRVYSTQRRGAPQSVQRPVLRQNTRGGRSVKRGTSTGRRQQ